MAVALVALLLAGCDTRADRALPSPAPSSASPSVRACGPVTRPVRLPTGSYGLRAGPFGFLGRRSPNEPSTMTRPPSKVVFAVLDAFDEEYTVTGFRCADGEPMRFWYREEPVPRDGRGDLAATIPPVPEVDPPGRLGRGGYLIPASEGRWQLDFAVGGRVAHSVVVDVVFAR